MKDFIGHKLKNAESLIKSILLHRMQAKGRSQRASIPRDIGGDLEKLVLYSDWCAAFDIQFSILQLHHSVL